MKRGADFTGHILSYVRRKKRALLVSLFNALLLTVLVYYLNNQPLFTGENLEKFTWIQWLKDKVANNDNDPGDDKTFYVNVSYDKQLVPYTDDSGFEVGTIPVTDREKLIRFLQQLKETAKYKYLFLDISFERSTVTPADSALFSLLKVMPNTVIATYHGLDQAPGVPKEKTALSQYYSTIVATNFVRYKYSFDGLPSIPLYAYNELTGKSIEDHKLFYSSDGSLCHNSLFIDFPSKGFTMLDDDGNQNYYNLGADILDVMDSEDIIRLTEGKYVIIGDFVNDVHDTYVGKLPGAVITYRAFDALMHEKHLVSIPLLLIFAFVYFLISMSLFSRKSLLSYLPFISNSKSKALHFIVSLIEFTLLLSMITIVMGIFFNIYASILIPSVYFTVLKTIINYKRHKI